MKNKRGSNRTRKMGGEELATQLLKLFDPIQDGFAKPGKLRKEDITGEKILHLLDQRSRSVDEQAHKKKACGTRGGWEERSARKGRPRSGLNSGY